MKFRQLATAALLAPALVVAATGIGQAEPALTPSKVGFGVKKIDKTVVTTLDSGRFEVTSDTKSVAIKDDSGKTVETLPLSYTYGGSEYPIRYEISPKNKRELSLTPITDRAAAKPAPKKEETKTKQAAESSPEQAKPRVHLKQIASVEENALAQQNLMNQLGIATSVGSIVGTILGVVVGGAIGAVVALGSCLALLACLVVGVPIFVTFASAGAILGTVVAGGGALVSSGWDFIQTQQAAPGTTHYQTQIDQTNAKLRQQQAHR